MKGLGFLSSEEVERHKQLFLDALQWYEARVVEQNRLHASYIRDIRYSLIPSLKERTTFGKEMPSDELKLLGAILQEYQNHLTGLQREPWTRQTTVQSQLNELNDLARDNLVKIGKPKAAIG